MSKEEVEIANYKTAASERQIRVSIVHPGSFSAQTVRWPNPRPTGRAV
jgi:hypothetical protein